MKLFMCVLVACLLAGSDGASGLFNQGCKRLKKKMDKCVKDGMKEFMPKCFPTVEVTVETDADEYAGTSGTISVSVYGHSGGSTGEAESFEIPTPAAGSSFSLTLKDVGAECVEFSSDSDNAYLPAKITIGGLTLVNSENTWVSTDLTEGQNPVKICAPGSAVVLEERSRVRKTKEEKQAARAAKKAAIKLANAPKKAAKKAAKLEKKKTKAQSKCFRIDEIIAEMCYGLCA